jgi:hypothetical protein
MWIFVRCTIFYWQNVNHHELLIIITWCRLNTVTKTTGPFRTRSQVRTMVLVKSDLIQSFLKDIRIQCWDNTFAFPLCTSKISDVHMAPWFVVYTLMRTYYIKYFHGLTKRFVHDDYHIIFHRMLYTWFWQEFLFFAIKNVFVVIFPLSRIV